MQRLEKLLNELELEFTCIFARNYNLMLEVKKEGAWNEEERQKLKNIVKIELVDKKIQAVSEFCFICHP